jgi:hypothetical protein
MVEPPIKTADGRESTHLKQNRQKTKFAAKLF